MEQMQRVVTNDRIDAGLALLFLGVVVSITLIGLNVGWRAFRARGPSTIEAAYVVASAD